VLPRRWLAAAFVPALLLVPAPAGADTQPPTIRTIESSLASALSRAQTTRIVRVHKHRTNTPGFVTAVAWVDPGDGRQRIVWRDASGRVTRDASRPSCAGIPAGRRCTLPPLPSAACGCDLNPFTNFPGQSPQISLLGQETLGGQRTFHVRFAIVAGPQPSTTDFWISRSTNLPVRAMVSFRAEGRRTITTTDDFAWLPRTSANLARVANG
jgi:hypothetical protein